MCSTELGAKDLATVACDLDSRTDFDGLGGFADDATDRNTRLLLIGRDLHNNGRRRPCIHDNETRGLA